MVDLFTGTGGFSVGLEFCTCVLSNDFCTESLEIYNLNHPPGIFLLKNIMDIDVQEEIPKHNILTGGFPCQPFSIAGTRKGFDDIRSNVFWKIIEILRIHQPEVIILENVKNLMTHDEGRTYETIIDQLTTVGYHIKSAILDTSKITGVPHHRERIYIVGFKSIEMSEAFNFEFPIIPNRKITTFLEDNIQPKYYYDNRFKIFDIVAEGVIKHIDEDAVYQFRRKYVRENKSHCCPTLTANMGSGGHNVPLILDDVGIRKLTPRECFNLQGFPSSYVLPNLSDSKLYKLAGNAISVPVVSLISDKIYKLMI